MTGTRAGLVSAAALLAAITGAYAEGSTRSINLNAEQRHTIKEIILKEQNAAKADANVPTSVGAVVPAGVTTHSFPEEVAEKVPQVKAHVYVVKDNEVIIVNPNDRTVQEVID